MMGSSTVPPNSLTQVLGEHRDQPPTALYPVYLHYKGIVLICQGDWYEHTNKN